MSAFNSHPTSKKSIWALFTLSIIAMLLMTNLNVVFADTTTDTNQKITVSTGAVEQVTFATRMAKDLDAKQVAQDRQAKLNSVKAAQLAYRKQQEEIAAKAAAAKAAADKLAAEKIAAAKLVAQQAAAKAAAAKAAAIKAAAAKARTTATSGTSKGTFRISFYDPAALGSSMGYGGVAANLSVFPRGTRLKISMSNGQVLYRTVNDTGSFAYQNSRQLDVAMPNSMIPSAGILSAQVEVL